MFSALVGDNSDLFAAAAKLYIGQDDRVVDLTFGHGRFWHKVGHRNLVRADIRALPGVEVIGDCRLPRFPSGSFDAAVLDPPYKLGTSAQMREEFDGYGNNDRVERGAEGVKAFYHQSISAVWRILRPGGRLFVKVMDQVESGRNHFLSVDVHGFAMELGYEAIDKFVLVRRTAPVMRHPYQLHARKNHSYLWVFRRPERSTS